MKQTILKIASKVFGFSTAYAHCDIPCGIYDPHRAQIAALTIIRMDNFLASVKESDHNHDHDSARIIAVKETHAEQVKHEVRVIWGDFFKSEHLEKHPNLHELTHNIMQVASKARQGTDPKIGEELLELVNQFAEIFWEVKGFQTKRANAPYEPKLELVYPVL